MNVSSPVHVVMVGWNKVFSLERGIFCFVLFVHLFYTICFFLLVQGKFIDCNSVSTSIKPKHWEDLPYTSAPLRLSSEAAVVVKL